MTAPQAHQPLVTSLVSAGTLFNVRDRARQVASLFGLHTMQATRLVTAVSEIARNTVNFATEGHAAFGFERAGPRQPQQYVVVTFTDKGPGIPDVEAALSGAPRRKGKTPLGLQSARRLVDQFEIQSRAGSGTTVTLKMAIPRSAGPFDAAALPAMVDALVRQKPPSPLEELERQNREMLAALEELRLRQDELQKADERKNHFVAMLAHELRTPLGTLQMTQEIISRNLLLGPDMLAKRLEVMGRQTHQMARLISELMDVSRVSQGKIDLDLQPVEINELVEQTLEMCAADINARQHTLTVRREAPDLWAQGDATRLKQVFGNLLQNASRYTPTGGRIQVRIAREGGQAVIEVSDDGTGIAADTLPHIFDLFVQGNPGAVGGHSGLGIGLTLARRLIEGHHGTVTAQSNGPGQGSVFTVRLPLETAA